MPLFPPQSDGLQLGNPSFANTNEAFIVFDLFDAANEFNQIIVFDLFTGEGAVLESGGVIGFPSFSPDDSELIYEREDADSGALSLARIPLLEGRLETSGPTQSFRLNSESARWFVIQAEDPPTDVDDIQGVSLPGAMALEQNYPNPFNTSTVIPYNLVDSGSASLTVYDLTGRRVTKIASGYKQAGMHTVAWDGLDQEGRYAASGLYLYELTVTADDGTRQTSQARKMVLLR